MAESAAFAWLCSELELRSSLDRLEARGTVRIALKQAGLDHKSVTPEQMRVVVEKLLPGELKARSIDDDALCGALASGLRSVDAGPDRGPEAPDEVFRRLGG